MGVLDHSSGIKGTWGIVTSSWTVGHRSRPRPPRAIRPGGSGAALSSSHQLWEAAPSDSHFSLYPGSSHHPPQILSHPRYGGLLAGVALSPEDSTGDFVLSRAVYSSPSAIVGC